MHICTNKNENIFLEENFDIITAYTLEPENEEIGVLHLHVTEAPMPSGDTQKIANPQFISVNYNYQRKGIAIAMLQYAETLYDKVIFVEDPGTVKDKDSIHYTSDGLALKNYYEQNKSSLS